MVRFMLNFIVCDDDSLCRMNVQRVVTKFMMSSKLEYKIHLFEDYGDSFLDIVNEKLPCKIYILDIDAPSRTGIDVARIIRYKDRHSVIIFLTGYEELSSVVSKKNFSFLTFINKFDNYEEHLIGALYDALQSLDDKDTIEFKDCGTFYKIPVRDILYVTKDSVDRKSVIKTDYCEFRVNKTLNELSDMLNDNFIKTHRSCIVNKKRVVSYNKPRKSIVFDSGISIDLVSETYEGALL